MQLARDGPRLAAGTSCTTTPRAGRAASPAAGLMNINPATLSVRRSRWPSLFAPADGRSAWPPQSASGSGGHAPRWRRERPVSGRLEDVQKV
jgi:hypothetical protein